MTSAPLARPIRIPPSRFRVAAHRTILMLSWAGFMWMTVVATYDYVSQHRVPMGVLAYSWVFLVATWVLAQGSPAQESGPRCAACGARVLATRTADRGRLWTCFACGWECARRRSIRELAPEERSWNAVPVPEPRPPS